jgi:hypothetical protein
VVGDGQVAVVEDVVVVWLLEVVAGYRPLGDWRELGQDALAGAAGVQLVGWKDSIDFEWFEHGFSPRWALNGQGLLVALVAACSPCWPENSPASIVASWIG